MWLHCLLSDVKGLIWGSKKNTLLCFPRTLLTQFPGRFHLLNDPISISRFSGWFHFLTTGMLLFQHFSSSDSAPLPHSLVLLTRWVPRGDYHGYHIRARKRTSIEGGTESHRFSFIIGWAEIEMFPPLSLYTYRFNQIWATILASRRAIIYCLCAKCIGHIGCIQRAWPEGVWKEKMLHLKLDKWPIGLQGKSYLFP